MTLRFSSNLTHTREQTMELAEAMKQIDKEAKLMKMEAKRLDNQCQAGLKKAEAQAILNTTRRLAELLRG